MNQVFTASSGKSIGYRIFGTDAEEMILFFHGSPGSSIQADLIYPLLRQKGVRILSFDRRGYGSTSIMTRDQQSTALKELLTTLGVKSVNIWAWGGGVASATHFAIHSKLEIKSVQLFSPIMPNLKRYTSFSERCFLRMLRIPGLALMTLNSSRTKQQLVQRAGPADKMLLFDPSVQKIFLVSEEVEQRQRLEGLRSDLADLSQDWLQAVEGMACPVNFWQGSDDAFLKHKKISNLPGVKIMTLTGEGYISTLIRGAREVLGNA